LTNEEKISIKETFELFDKDGDGCLDERELKKALEELGQHPNNEEVLRMINEVDHDNKGYMDFKDFLRAMALQKFAKHNIDEDDIIDAYVAMGGNTDKTGYVDASRLINIIKDEFKMTIDIERMISEIDEDKSSKIEYGEFKTLLS